MVGHCLYTQEQFNQFEDHTRPEIQRAPLEAKEIALLAKSLQTELAKPEWNGHAGWDSANSKLWVRNGAPKDWEIRFNDHSFSFHQIRREMFRIVQAVWTMYHSQTSPCLG